jgi:hypothetical protein
LLIGFRVALMPQKLLAAEASNFGEAYMGLRFRIVLAALAFAGVFAGASAQDHTRDPVGGGATKTASPRLTGKERLGRKWTDEQRIDNCHVPVDKRGLKPRPSACPSDPSS